MTKREPKLPKVRQAKESLSFKLESPELFDRALAAGVPKDQAKKLRVKDSEILATALFYQANRFTIYDPFLLFLGHEYIERETGLVIEPPTSPFLPFPEEEKK